MNKFGKAFIALIVCFSLAIPLVVSLNYSASPADFSGEKYLSDIAEIYREYDGDLSKKDKDDPLALNRIVVSNYNGKKYGCVKRAWDTKHKIGVLQYETRKDAEEAIKAVRRDGLVAEGDGIAYFDNEIKETPESIVNEAPALASEKGTLSPSSSGFLGTKQYIEKLNAEEKDEVVVAIVDTGVMYEHTAIADRFCSTGVDLSSDKAPDAHYDTDMVGEYYDHATMVSGVIADNTPDNVKIFPYKVVAFGANGAAASAIMNGLYEAVDSNAKVISVSLSTNGCYSYIEEAITNGRQKGICVCASAGNSSKVVTGMYPACCTYAITVSALNTDNTTIAPFSNYGENIDFTAPGRRIHTTAPVNGDSGYVYGSGTSFSTPYISACCACIKSDYPDMPRDDVYSALCDFATDLGDEGYDIYYGNGAPNLSNMVYTDGENYSFSIPENTLEIYTDADYTADTQPWKKYATVITDVTVDPSVERLANYVFYKMPNAQFNMRESYNSIGSYAFYGCTQLGGYTCTIDVEEIGQGAFGGIEGFVLSGYRNTPAESYALSENITFNALGCKHSYKHVVYDPTKTSEGYTLYTCTVCGEQYVGKYIEPTPVETGKCGDNLTYTYFDTGRLTIEGSGDMYDYMNTPAPWADYKDSIMVLQVKEGVGDVSPFAFYGCTSLSRFFISDGNSYYYDDDEYNLVRKSDGALLLAIMGTQNSPYTVRERINSLNSTAFIVCNPSAVVGNGYTTNDGIVYNSDGDIAMALPSYNKSGFEFGANCDVNEYAFIYCPGLLKISGDYIRINVGRYGLGYYYDGTMNKQNALFVTNASSGLYQYASDNGFAVDLGVTGKCGDDILWRYNEEESSLTLTGSGDMYTFESEELVPWKEYIPTLKKAVIADSITSLSPYSFNKATKLSDLTLPLSIEAPKDINTWNGCNAIKKLTLTLGTGRTDDYVEADGTELYKFTPWFISKSSITSFSLDENVKYITSEAFRNCTCIKSLKFNCIEKIERRAFVACTSLTEITNYCRNTVYDDLSIFSYQFGTAAGGYYANKTLKGYSDSTSKDFCTANPKINFESIGCGHSRSTSYVRDEARDEFITDVIYHCDDCGNEFVHSYYDSGSELTLSVFTKKGMTVENAEIYLDGELFGVTDSKGAVRGKLPMGSYPLEMKVNGISVFENTLTLSSNTVNASLRFQYANYVKDGAINGKDYAYSLRNGLGDGDLFDYGKISDEYNRIIYNEN